MISHNQRQPTVQQTPSLSQLWAERDALVATSTIDHELRIRRLENEIARRTALAGLAAEVDRPASIVEILGEPPVSLDGRQAWRVAAGATESYRARWDADTIDAPIGAVQAQLDHLAEVERLVERAVEPHAVPDAVAGLDID